MRRTPGSSDSMYNKTVIDNVLLKPYTTLEAYYDFWEHVCLRLLPQPPPPPHSRPRASAPASAPASALTSPRLASPGRARQSRNLLLHVPRAGLTRTLALASTLTTLTLTPTLTPTLTLTLLLHVPRAGQLLHSLASTRTSFFTNTHPNLYANPNPTSSRSSRRSSASRRAPRAAAGAAAARPRGSTQQRRSLWA